MFDAPAGKIKLYSSVNLSKENILIVWSLEAEMKRFGCPGISMRLVTYLVWTLKEWMIYFFFCSFQTMTLPESVEVMKYLYFSDTSTSVIKSS
jgi:hypothetical protein